MNCFPSFAKLQAIWLCCTLLRTSISAKDSTNSNRDEKYGPSWPISVFRGRDLPGDHRFMCLCIDQAHVVDSTSIMKLNFRCFDILVRWIVIRLLPPLNQRMDSLEFEVAFTARYAANGRGGEAACRTGSTDTITTFQMLCLKQHSQYEV